MYCSNCGNQIDKAAKFCPSCGATQETKTNHVSPQTVDGVNKVMGEAKTHINKGKENGQLYMIIGWITTVVSLLFFPVLFGAAAVIMGYLYRSYDEKHGTILMIAGVAGGLFGTILGFSLF